MIFLLICLLILWEFHKMHFDYIHPQLLTQLFIDLPSPPYLSQFYVLLFGVVFFFFFLNNLFTPICAVHILLSVGPSTGVWKAYQEPNP